MIISDKEKELIRRFLDCDVNELALRLKANDDFRPKVVLQQIAGRQIMSKKMSEWSENEDIIYPVHLSLEQCSSEATANYKYEIASGLCKKDEMLDLTGGFGVDFYSISRDFKHAIYVEMNSELCEIVKTNFKILERRNADFQNNDGVEVLKKLEKHTNLIFIDPARRDKSGSKTVHIADCVPNIIDFQDIMTEKSDIVMIKLSPMLDISECKRELRNIREIHIISVNNECKEILVILERNYVGEPRIFTINNDQRLDFTKSEESECQTVIADKIDSGMYLYEPNASIMKAGAYKTLSKKYNVKELHQSSHLYVSESEIYDFPGRKFKILGTGSVKDFKDLKKANLAVRNFPMKTEELKKKMKLKDGGDVYLFATTIKGDKKLIIKTEKA